MAKKEEKKADLKVAEEAEEIEEEEESEAKEEQKETTEKQEAENPKEKLDVLSIVANHEERLRIIESWILRLKNL